MSGLVEADVELVARAIAGARSWQTEPLTVGNWDDRSMGERQPFIEMAEAAIAAWNTRASDPLIEQLVEALERARSDFHLISLHASVRPMWEDAKAGRDRVHDALSAARGGSNG